MRRILLLLSGVLVLALSIPGEEAGAQTRNQRVCLPGNTPAFLYLYIAKERGYFAEEKMAVEILAARGQLCVTALMAGQVDFTTNPNAFDLMITGKLQGKVLYSAARGLAHRLIVARNVKGFGDLKGKTIAIATFGGLTDKLTREILSRHSLEAMKDVMLLQIGTTDVRWAALRSDRVQGALLVGQHAMAALEEGFRELEYESPPHLSGPLIAKDESLAREPSRVRSFVRAAMKGHLFFRQKPEETLAIMQKAFRIEDKTVARQLYKDEMRRYNSGGRFEEPYLRKVIERVKQDRRIDREIGIKELFDFSIAAEVEAGLRKKGWSP